MASERLQTSGVMFEIQSGAERWFVFARLRRPNPPKQAGRKLDVWESDLFLINKRKQMLKGT